MPVFATGNTKRRMRTHFVMNARPVGSTLVVPKKKGAPGTLSIEGIGRPRPRRMYVAASELFDSFFGLSASNPILGIISGLVFDERRQRLKAQRALRDAHARGHDLVRHHQHRGS